jgi:16S rRNA processing protein RimM
LRRSGSSDYDAETLSIGVLGRPHGVAGELALRPHHLGGDALATLTRLILVKDGRSTEHEIVRLRPVAQGYLVRLAGIDSREAAAPLTLSDVRVPRSVLPPLGEGEFYVEDVAGCAVENEDGAALGRVDATFWNGAHDVMTVIDATGAERLIPLIPEFVLAVDTAARRLRVRWRDDA